MLIFCFSLFLIEITIFQGPRDAPNYYIACQAPLDATVEDFWRLIWEQQSRVIIQATDLIENGVEKCAEYLPPSVTLDNHSTFGDFHVLLQNREVKNRYAISTLLLKCNSAGEKSREITHYWYKWPENGVPNEEAPLIAMLLEVRSSLISYGNEAPPVNDTTTTSLDNGLVNGNGGVGGGSTKETVEVTTVNGVGNGSSGETVAGKGSASILMPMTHFKKTAKNQG